MLSMGMTCQLARQVTGRQPHVCLRCVAIAVRVRAVGLTYAHGAWHPPSAYVPLASRMPTVRRTHRLPTCRRPHVCLQRVAPIVCLRAVGLTHAYSAWQSS